jgi:tRNA pseudouridine32 synthase/23S rRNA pseudouridine746 synthase
VTPAGHYLQETLLVRLKNKTGIKDLTPIHRIDRETAGLVAFSKRAQDRNLYQVLFRERQIKKTYEAIALYQEHLKDQFPIERISRIEESDIFIQMQEVPGEPNSDTVIQLLEVSKPWAKYQLELGTGKKHQLRVHMNALGMPIKYDKIYPNIVPQPKMGKDFSEPLQLLAKQLSFRDPVTQLEHNFQSQFCLNLGDHSSANPE